MLFTSPEDDRAFVPIELSQEPPGLTAGYQSNLERDPASPIAATATIASKLLAGDRYEMPVSRSVVQPSSLVQSPHHQSASLKNTSLPETDLDGLYALRQVAKRQTVRRPQPNKWSRVALPTSPDNLKDSESLGSYAAPLSPLRERDILALAALFQRDDMYAIEADVKHKLLSLLPEPCWDDDTFAFLGSSFSSRVEDS
ncbi:hypothetical protein [Leptolyngbya sp. FACHB-321]|uniref:hypothetical protein n=1 Tax=Leptolyngbya sp. FACHB-321 TaxID=2692807 RepID=UPI0018EFBA9C|nr:hypothetical protein [Leptolyngbya sp. FACHB-321]